GPLAAAEAPAVRAPDAVRDDELLARGGGSRLVGEAPGGVCGPGVDVDLHPAAVAGGISKPVGRAMPVDGLVPVDAERLADPPVGDSCEGGPGRDGLGRRGGRDGEERRGRKRYGCAVPQNRNLLRGDMARALFAYRGLVGAAWAT